MAAFDVAGLVEPISAGEPCGPDLDLEGDLVFLQFMARIEGTMPASFFTRDDEGRQQPFDRASIDFAAEGKAIAGLLERTRDLRLLAVLCRLAALNRDLAGLASGLAGIAALLQTRWADVHPRGEDGDYGLRSAVLQALDDMPTVILPLQHIALADSRRFGPITFRSVMIADGEAAAPAGAEAIDRAAIMRTLAEADLDKLRAQRASLGTILDSAGIIYATMVAEASFEQAAKLERLTGLGNRIAALLDSVVSARDPAAGAPSSDALEDAAGPAPAAGGETAGGVEAKPVTTMRDASAALAAAGRYLQAFEPSSPAALLVRQAQALVGKSFLDVLRMLVPAYADDARIPIGADRAFELSFGQLASMLDMAAGDETPEPDAAAGDAAEPESPAAPDVTPFVTPFVATSRREASSLMNRVAAFYRGAEPSSPIPLILDRAVATIERDFLALLRDVLPDLMRRDGN